MKKTESDRGEVILYKNRVEVRLDQETVWLTQAQIAEVLGTKRPAITKHLSNIFKTKELERRSVCSKMEHTAADGKIYLTQYYNLDVIISVGYRVNSIENVPGIKNGDTHRRRELPLNLADDVCPFFSCLAPSNTDSKDEMSYDFSNRLNSVK